MIMYKLLVKLTMICYFNPYCLVDYEDEADCAEYDVNGIVGIGDDQTYFATPDNILRWLEIGSRE